MAHQTLQRRTTQLALLDDACRAQASGHLALRKRPASARAVTLLTLDDDCVIVEWRAENGHPAERPGEEVIVEFTHENVSYRMFTRTRARLARSWTTRGPIPVLRLNLPLRIERWEVRRTQRVSLREITPVVARFTSMLDSARVFEARVMDVSQGGIGVTASVELPFAMRGGEPFWVEFELPGERERFEFAARLAHQRTLSGRGIAQGWAFQPADDSAVYDDSLQRLAEFVAEATTD